MTRKPYISGLLYPDMKTARATEHLEHLRALLQKFRTDKPYAVTKKTMAKRDCTSFASN